MLFPVVVLITCAISVQATWYSDQPIVARYFDSILQQTSKVQREVNFVASIRNSGRALLWIYHACQKNEESKLSVEFDANTVYPHLCGTIGYSNRLPTQHEWRIQQLNSNVGIKLSVLYLKLPFLGLTCEFSNITINAYHGQTLCGVKSGSVFYSNFEMIITLNQGYELDNEAGFTAVYTAFQHIPWIIKPLILWTRLGITSQRISPYYENKHVSDKQSWHIVGYPYSRIYFPALDGVTVHDGPWCDSPILYSATYTTAFCAYVLQNAPGYNFQYETVAHAQYSNSSDIDVRSSCRMNKISIYKISPGTHALVVKNLNITYMGMMAHFVERCQYGGLFVYSASPGRTSVHKKRFDFCQTHSGKEFTIQLSDESTHYVYIIMYAAYTAGYVQADIQTRQCVNQYSEVLVNLAFGCNYFQYILWPDLQLAIIKSKSKLPLGPISVKFQIVNLMYSTELKGLSMASIDHDIFQINEYVHSESISDSVQHEFNNLQMLKIRYRPSKWFSSINLFTTEIYNKRFVHGDRRQESVHNISQVALFFSLDHVFHNNVKLTGSMTYYISGIAIQPTYANLHLAYDDYQCQKTCSASLTDITEYIRVRRTFKTWHAQSIGLFWGNAWSKGSFTVVIAQQKEYCTHCQLDVFVAPAVWITNMDSPPEKETLIHPHR